MGVPGHVEDVEAPLVEVFQFLLGEHKKPEWFEWFFQAVPKSSQICRFNGCCNYVSAGCEINEHRVAVKG